MFQAVKSQLFKVSSTHFQGKFFEIVIDAQEAATAVLPSPDGKLNLQNSSGSSACTSSQKQTAGAGAREG